MRNLTAPGVEPHELELSPKEVDTVEGAGLVVMLGRDFQPAVERVARRNKSAVALLDRLHVQGDDPHIWLDPTLMGSIVDIVASALASADPAHAVEFTTRAAALRGEVTALDGRYRSGLATCQRKEIVTSHEAFGRMAARYGLTQRAITGLSPEAEPDPARLAALTDLIKRDGVTTVFTEELVSPRVADTLAREAHVRTEVLSPIEGLTNDEVAKGESYITLMDSNLAKLRTALACG